MRLNSVNRVSLMIKCHAWFRAEAPLKCHTNVHIRLLPYTGWNILVGTLFYFRYHSQILALGMFFLLVCPETVCEERMKKKLFLCCELKHGNALTHKKYNWWSDSWEGDTHAELLSLIWGMIQSWPVRVWENFTNLFQFLSPDGYSCAVPISHMFAQQAGRLDQQKHAFSHMRREQESESRRPLLTTCNSTLWGCYRSILYFHFNEYSWANSRLRTPTMSNIHNRWLFQNVHIAPLMWKSKSIWTELRCGWLLRELHHVQTAVGMAICLGVLWMFNDSQFARQAFERTAWTALSSLLENCLWKEKVFWIRHGLNYSVNVNRTTAGEESERGKNINEN